MQEQDREKTTGDGMGVRVCGEQKTHKPEGENVSEKFALNVHDFRFFRCYL